MHVIQHGVKKFMIEQCGVAPTVESRVVEQKSFNYEGFVQGREIEMDELNSIVIAYEECADGVQGIKDLQNAGFNMMNLSIAAREYPGSPEHIMGYCSIGGQIKYWGKMGTMLGKCGAFWAGAAFFILPGVGPVLMAGPLIAGVVASMENGSIGGGLGVFGAGLRRLGIPRESVLRYESELGSDILLLIAHGTAQELLRARDILHATRPSELNVHFAQEVARAGGNH